MSVEFANSAETKLTPAWMHVSGILRRFAVRGLATCRIRLKASHAERRMELLETLHLGAKRQLMLVQCDGRRYLVGLGSDSVHSIVTAAQLSCSSTDDVPNAGLQG